MTTEIAPPVFRQIRQYIEDNPRPTYPLRHISYVFGLKGNPNGKYADIIHEEARNNGVEVQPGKAKTLMEPDVFERVCQSVALRRGIESIDIWTEERLALEVDQYITQHKRLTVKDIHRATGRSGLSKAQRRIVIDTTRSGPEQVLPRRALPEELFRVLCLKLGPPTVYKQLPSTLEQPATDNATDIKTPVEKSPVIYTLDNNELYVLGRAMSDLTNRKLFEKCGLRITEDRLIRINNLVASLKKECEIQGNNAADIYEDIIPSLIQKLTAFAELTDRKPFFNQNSQNALALLGIINGLDTNQLTSLLKGLFPRYFS